MTAVFCMVISKLRSRKLQTGILLGSSFLLSFFGLGILLLCFALEPSFDVSYRKLEAPDFCANIDETEAGLEALEAFLGELPYVERYEISQRYLVNHVELTDRTMEEEEKRGAGERFTRADIIVEFLLLLFIIYMALLGFTDGYRNMRWFLDWGSFGFIVGVTVLVLLIAGMLPDFVRAFPLGFGKQEKGGKEEVQMALTAVKTVLFTLPLSGVLVFVTGFILFSDSQTDGGELLHNMGAAMLAFLYSILMDLLLLPVAVRLKRRL